MKIIVVPSSSEKIRPNGKRVQKSVSINSTPLLVLGALLFTWIGASSYLLGQQIAEKNQLSSIDSSAKLSNNTTSSKFDNPEVFKAWKKKSNRTKPTTTIGDQKQTRVPKQNYAASCRTTISANAHRSLSVHVEQRCQFR